jgi:hypothetical protein
MKIYFILIGLFVSYDSFAQVEESKLGAWYMYFYNVNLNESAWGIQGDFQYRNWNTIGDLEQLLLRFGVTYTPKNTTAVFTVGYANITTGTAGENDNTFGENRIYQEALIPQKIAKHFFLTHRFRCEQRWVENQDFRTRLRYNLFLNITLNDTELKKGVFYAAFYNKLFINGERSNGVSDLELFDRNRTYFGLGYALSFSSRIQLGWMRQETNNWTKGQLQFSLHQNVNF